MLIMIIFVQTYWVSIKPPELIKTLISYSGGITIKKSSESRENGERYFVSTRYVCPCWATFLRRLSFDDKYEIISRDPIYESFSLFFDFNFFLHLFSHLVKTQPYLFIKRTIHYNQRNPRTIPRNRAFITTSNFLSLH